MNKSMNITIFGTNHSALTVASCLAEVGHKVMFVCLNENLFNDNIEVTLEKLYRKQKKNSSLTISKDIQAGLEFSDWLFFYFKSNEFALAQKLAKKAKDKIIVNASTFALGSSKKLVNSEKILNFPDFMVDGKYIESFVKPDRIVIGGNKKQAQELAQILKPLNQNDKIIFMSIESAELTKLATNAMLATRVSFINEIAQISALSGADIAEVTQGLGSDKRIGFDYLNVGTGFGGVSLEVNVQDLLNSAEHFGCVTPLLNSILSSNKHQKEVLFRQLWQYFKMDLKDKTIVLWGVSYKKDSADITNAPSLSIIEVLLSQGANVVICDKLAGQLIKDKFPAVSLKQDYLSSLKNADALLILTEHKEFKEIEIVKMFATMKQSIIFDGRNLFSLDIIKEMKQMGFVYHSIGRALQ
jgi:UDPglucose 6-dehydrogenase